MDVQNSNWPGVSVVIPTYNRPHMMRQALKSVLDQDYPGPLEIIVVYDKSVPEKSLEMTCARRTVRAISNTRTSGLAGARNSGILAADGDLVSFCDDDDTWSPVKLSTQVRALLARTGSQFATTAMLVDSDGRRSPRLAGKERIHYSDLLRSRMSMLHSSSFLVWRDALIRDIGLVDETLPQSMAEDWDLLLRAARRHDIVNVDLPLVNIRWGVTSYFADQWAVRNEAQLWLMDHYPEMLDDPVAAGLCYGKLAFGEAVQKNRWATLSWAMRAFRSNWRELRTYIALGVAAGLVPPRLLLKELSKRGHGI